MKPKFTLLRKAKYCAALFLIVMSIMLNNDANAATRTWIGSGAGGLGTDFNTGSNWSGGVAPSVSDDAVINVSFIGGINVSGNITINSLAITSTSAVIGLVTFTVSSGITFSTMGNVTISSSNSFGSLAFQLNNLGVFNVGGSFSCTSNVAAAIAATQSTITNLGEFNVSSNFSIVSNATVATASAQSYFSNQGNFSLSGNLSLSTTAMGGANSLSKNIIDNRSNFTVTGNVSMSNNVTGGIFNSSGSNYVVNFSNLTINGTTSTTFSGGTSGTSLRSVFFGTEDGATTTFNGDVNLTANRSSYDSLGFAGKGLLDVTRANSTGQVKFNKNLTLGTRTRTVVAPSPTLYTLPATFLFDGITGNTQILTNNSAYQIYFSNFQVGSFNSPIVNIAGSNNAQIYNANITVNNNAILDLGTKTLNRNTSGGTIALDNTATMKLAGSTGGQEGSNFPDNFLSYSFNSLSTVEYNAAGGTNQTVFAAPNYGNLTLSRVSGTTNTNKTLSATPLNVANDLTINTGATFVVSGTNSAFVGRNWSNTGTFTAGNGTVTFNGATNGIISGTSPSAFYNFVVNKGSSIATTLDVNGPGLVSTTVDAATTSILNGLLRINSSPTLGAFTKVAATSGGIQIASTAGIHVNGGIFTSNSNGSIANTGLFRVTSGTATIGNTSGNSLTTSGITTGLFDMQNGTLSVAGRLVNTAGSASITGGTITLNTIGNTSTSEGSFDMSLSTNLTITGTPGVYFQRAGTGGLDLRILNSSGTKTITGGTFQFGNGSTPVNSVFRCYSDIPVYNVTVNNTNNPNAILSKDLTINGTLILNSSNSIGAFSINGYTLTANSTIAGTGTLTGSLTSGLVLAGAAGTTGTLNFTPGGFSNYLKFFRINSGKSTDLGNALHIAAGTYIDPGVLTADGILSTNGNLTIKSDALGDGRIHNSSGTINGEVTVERFVHPRRAWRLMTVPFKQSPSDQTINTAWQEGQVSNTLPTACPTLDPAPDGYGMYITNNGTNGYDQNTTTNPSLRGWENSMWVVPPSTLTKKITDYEGYMAFVRGDRHICIQYGTAAGSNPTVLRAKGVLNQNGSDILRSFTTTATEKRILIGNPYVSPLRLTNVIFDGNINANSFTVLDPLIGGTYGTGAYNVFNTGINSWSTPGGVYDLFTSEPVIQSGQAFFVEGSFSATHSVTFEETAKTTLQFNTTGLARAQPQKETPVLYSQLLITQDSMKVADGVAVGFKQKFSYGKDEYDSPKFWTPEGESMAIANDTNRFAVDCRPVPRLTDTIFFKLYLRIKPYTLRFFARNPPGNLPGKTWLVDNYLGTKTELKLSDTTLYDFTPTSDTNTYRNRFMIVWSRTDGSIVKPGKPEVSSISKATVASLYPNPVSDNQFNLVLTNVEEDNYTVNIYANDGRLVVVRKLEYVSGKQTYQVNLPSTITSGSYRVQVLNSSGEAISSMPLIINR